MEWHSHLFFHPLSNHLLGVFHGPDPGDLAINNTDMSPALDLGRGEEEYETITQTTAQLENVVF